MLDRRKLAAEAAAKALALRKQLRIPLDEPACPIDCAEAIGIETRFVDLPSMEGMYIAGSAPTILLSSRRPQGRRRFTCAHELGHHIFNHGQQFDELREDRNARRTVDPQEFLADNFAAFFLMPKTALDIGMVRRNFTVASLTPLQVFLLASWLGVGYRTLISHLEYGLKMLPTRDANDLRKSSPAKIKHEVLGTDLDAHLHWVDQAWLGRAIDCEVKDVIHLPPGASWEGQVLNAVDIRKDGVLARVIRPGIARVSTEASGWAAYLRATREKYVGRGCFRYEEEIEE